MSERLWKVLGEDRQPYHGGHGRWAPPGEWMPPIDGTLVPCDNGYHVVRGDQLVQWLGPCIHAVEIDGDVIECDDKIVARRARLLGLNLPTWTERAARHFACDCAAQVRHLNDDPRVANAIRTARRFADRRTSLADLDAAGAAARAAGAAAWAARGAAGATARGAARAAGAAAWAAGAAARGAARAARDAAWAAGDAARDAAWDWQTQRLFAYLDGRIALGETAQ